MNDPHYNANLVRQKIDRTNDFKQAGETYRAFQDWELISNLVGALSVCQSQIRERMISYFTQADEEYGRCVREGLEQELAARGGTEHTGSAEADRVVDRISNKGSNTDGY